MYRLCRRILMFHHFPVELKTADYLACSTEFTYDEKPVASFITKITQSGHVAANQDVPDGLYLKKSLPPLEFIYSQVPDATGLTLQPIQEVSADSLENLPSGLDGSAYKWVDLDGEGISGVLSEQTGDGHADILIMEDRVLRWHPSLAEEGFGPSETVPKPFDEETGPAIVFADSTQSVYLADLSGDGLTDIVRIRNGEVDY
jgi:hypothetical protein